MDFLSLSERWSAGETYKEFISALQDISALFVRSQDEEKARLQDAVRRVVDLAEVIALDSLIVSNSLTYQASGFTPQDSVVYASVLEHLRAQSGEEYVFLNRNSKDFDDPDVQDELARFNCRIIFRFDDGYNFVASRVGATDA